MPTPPNWNKKQENNEEIITVKEIKKPKVFTDNDIQNMEVLEDIQDEILEAQKIVEKLQKKHTETALIQIEKQLKEENSENKNDISDKNTDDSKLKKLLHIRLKNTGKKPGIFGISYDLIMQILLAGVMGIFLYNFLNNEESEQLTISEFTEELKKGEFSEVIIRGETATGTRKTEEEKKGEVVDEELPEANKVKVTTILGMRDSFKDLGFFDEKLTEQTKIEIKETESNLFLDILLSFLPLVLIMGLIMYSMKGMKGGMGGFPFGEKGKGMDPIKPDTTFDDVAGQDEAKYELKEIVEFLRKPSQFLKMGAKIPKGVLMSGPPGTGKTLLARAVAGEAHVPFFSISGSEFVEMFVGVGASRVRKIFENARKHAPAIIFIDEIDAIGRKRSSGMGGSNSEMEQTLNQILTEMDGFENDTGVIVMAATNREEILDTALLRPGRFDRKITIGNPTIKDREAILKVHSKNKPIDKNVNLEKISARTVGFSGADLQNLLNESAIFAARAKSKTITDKHIDLAIDRIAMGTEKKSLVMSDEEKKMTAYHEVGHALMAHLMPKADPVHKITIVPRGRSLGATHMAPDKESYHSTKQKYLDEICVLLGGLSAEKIIFKDTTSGVSNDLERATTIANAMVKKFGMSDEIGPMIFMDPGEHALAKSHSEEFSGKIDTEVQAILKNSYKKTLQTLEDNMDLLHSISKDLLEKETLSREQFEAFFKK
ncbi:TPA: ATP-dependent zinc metalloprotease FtsH [Candidatus Gracilibacteria bacterium]|nr:ATP-dependent zinc metalloprotease FtsH [Candidatus Gracilibacteria bacterium]